MRARDIEGIARRKQAAGCGYAIVALLWSAFAAGLVAAGSAQASNTMYKWTDDKGEVHYTDKMPADMVNRGNVEISKQGLEVKKTGPQPTAEQRKAMEAEAQHQREQAKEKEDLARRDRAVLDSYTTEADIDLARNRALKTIDSALQSAQSYTAQLVKRKEALQTKPLDPKEKNAQANRERDLSRLDTDIAAQNAIIAQKQREIVATNAKYDLDKAKWQAALERQRLAASLPTTTTPVAAPTDAAAKAKK